MYYEQGMKMYTPTNLDYVNGAKGKEQISLLINWL